MPKHYQTDSALREALIAYRDRTGITNAKLATLTEAKSATFISKYINDKLDHDPTGWEEKAADILKGLDRQREFSESLFETSVTKGIQGRINVIRRTGDIALLHSPAGVGKSCAGRLYVVKHPSSLYVHLNARTRDAGKVEAAVFDALETRTWSGRTSRFGYMVDRLKGTGRVILIDNAQRMSADGRAWLFDFWDETRLPIAMIGNPEVMDKIRANDQHFSRVGISHGFKLKPAEIPKLSTIIASQIAGEDIAEEISDLAAFTGKHPGHLRAVEKTVKLATELMAHATKYADDPRGAYYAAHSQLVRDYDLPTAA